jgi:hypothetical protein
MLRADGRGCSRSGWDERWLRVRLVVRFLVLFLAAYGPLAPIMLAFLVAVPPLIALSGWPWWADLAMALPECSLLIGGALWLGPGALAEARAFLEEERRRDQ